MNFEDIEEEYFVLSNNFKEEKRINKKILRQYKRTLNNKFRFENKKLFLILDILFVCLILFNIGALVLTNMMVMKANPNTVLVEANPTAAENYQLVEHKDARPFMTGFMMHVLAWSYLIGWYLFNRFEMHTTKEYYLFIMIFIFLGVMLSLDFFNNFGFFLGKIIWG